jgi:glutamine synthetase
MITILEYIWLDSNNKFRSKTKVIDLNKDLNIKDLPEWNYDGSSTGQATTENSEVFIKPVAFFKDPFRQYTTSYLVWCDTINITTHKRKYARTIFNNSIIKQSEPWFGIEQEYFIMSPESNQPISFVENKMAEQGPYYCGIGPNNALGRNIPEKHMEFCLFAEIKICGINAEVAPGQWEYQIGPCVGLEAGDHLWVSRYILDRVAENYGYSISYHPKPLVSLQGSWNGSGCHTNFSTKEMRDESGLVMIDIAIKKLSKTHAHHISNYGEDNHLRLSGSHETSSIDEFSCGYGNRGASIRIPNNVLTNKRGYFEDRRPASNCDPYIVTALLAESCLL